MVLGPCIAGLGFAALASASFLFALAETSLFALGRWQARQLPERDPARGALVLKLLNTPQDLLATIVLGNTCANGGLVAIGLWLVLGAGWPAPATLPAVLLVILVVGEVIPKTLGARAPGFWAVRLAQWMASFQRATRPLREVAQRWNTVILQRCLPPAARPSSTATSEDYAELLEMAQQQGALDQAEKEIILQIISLSQRTAKEVMKPRAQLDALPDDLSVEEMIAAARRLKHRRIPLYDGTPDTIVGILNTRVLLLNPQVDLAEAIEFPSFVPETINLLQLLKSLQRQRRGLAIVLDEYGSTAGVVTMEEILGALVGHIRGEGEAEGFVMEKLGEGRWRVNGTMRLDDFRREYPALGDYPGVETLGGLMLALVGVVPNQGESAVFRGLRFTARAADDRRVRELLIETLRKGEGGSA